MSKQQSIQEFLVNFENGMYQNSDKATQCNAGWYDWFCDDSSLKNKTYRLAPKLKSLITSSKINIYEDYVFFKNNCPSEGSLYDDFRICDRETGDVKYTISPKDTHQNGLASVYGRDNNFLSPLASGTWGDVKDFFAEVAL
mgnify:FL=1